MYQRASLGIDLGLRVRAQATQVGLDFMKGQAQAGLKFYWLKLHVDLARSTPCQIFFRPVYSHLNSQLEAATSHGRVKSNEVV